MKMIFILLITTLTLTVNGQAQNHRFGAKGGINYATLTGMQQANISGRAGLHGGVLYLYGVYQPVALHVELLYSAQGFSRQPIVTDGPTESLRSITRDRFHYLTLPVLFKIKRGSFFFEAGPRVSYLFRARSETTLTTSRVGMADEVDQQDHNILGSLNRLDYGGAAGFGFMVNENLDVNVRYNASLRPARKNEPGNTYDVTGHARNSYFQFSVSYFIPGFP